MYKLLRRLPSIPLKFFLEEFTAAGKPPFHNPQLYIGGKKAAFPQKKEMRRDGTSP